MSEKLPPTSEPMPEGYDWEDHSYCFIHFKPEPITSLTYIVCFECGHVWTAHALRKAWRFHQRRYRDWWKRPRHYFRRARRIYFCQECIHDF